MTGVIALDIDGTAAVMGRPINFKVSSYLSELVQSGWEVVFITGRSFPMLSETLQRLHFPYHLAIQNGAILIRMPEKIIVYRRCIPKEVLPAVVSLSSQEGAGFAVYAGLDYDNICYFQKNIFPEEQIDYLLRRAKALGEKWKEVIDYQRLPIPELASLKFFGGEYIMKKIADRLENEGGLNAQSIRDAFSPDKYVAQATHADADKGKILKIFMDGKRGIIIAAGDDCNDRSMLAGADVRIVMETSPKEILAMGDIVAPSAERDGLIEGLQKAVRGV